MKKLTKCLAAIPLIIGSLLHADHWSFAMSVNQSQGVIQESDEGPFIDLTSGNGMQLPDGLVGIPGKEGNLIFRGEFKLSEYPPKGSSFVSLVGWGALRDHSRVQIHITGKRIRGLICPPGKGLKPTGVISDGLVQLNTWHSFEFRMIRGKPMEIIIDGQSAQSDQIIRNQNIAPTAPLCLGIAYQPGEDARKPFKGLLRNFEVLTGTDIE